MVISGTKQPSGRGKSLVGFKVGGVAYAVDILLVREILNPLPVVPLPRTTASVIGVAEHRGEVIAVLDLRLRFGLERHDRTQSTKWIIVHAFGRPIALVADAVTEVFGTNEQQGWNSRMPELGETSRGIRAVYRKSVEENATALVFVLDVEQVVEPARHLEVQPELLAGESGAQP